MEGNGVENDGLMLIEEQEKEAATTTEEEIEMLKKSIAGHPLYGLLIKTHLTCLKVCIGDIGEVDMKTSFHQADYDRIHAANPRSSHLDKFMEVYCMALSKLKEAMEKPQQETAAFIEAMYVQLSELSLTPEPTFPS